MITRLMLNMRDPRLSPASQSSTLGFRNSETLTTFVDPATETTQYRDHLEYAAQHGQNW
jgi:hypothetical protein